ILCVLIHDAAPLRLHELGEDPRSVGFPPGHPPMHTFLGVPVMLRGVAYGNLYLTEKDNGEDFSDEDEELVTLLAAQAAVAIENARLYESATRWSRQLESLHEIVGAIGEESELERLLELVCRRLREPIGARPADRHRRRARQAGARSALLGRRPPSGRDLRGTRRRGRRSLGARCTRHRAPRDRGTGAGAAPARARAPRRDGPGAHVDPARP